MTNLLQITYWTIGGFEGQTPIRQALEDAKACGYDGLELAFGAGELDRRYDARDLPADPRGRPAAGHCPGDHGQRQLLGVLLVVRRSDPTQGGGRVHAQVHRDRALVWESRRSW